MKDIDKKIRECAIYIVNLPHSIACDICTREYCRDGKEDMSCVDCVEHYLKSHTRKKEDSKQ